MNLGARYKMQDEEKVRPKFLGCNYIISEPNYQLHRRLNICLFTLITVR